MVEKSLVKVRGFDLFFRNASWLHIQKIGADLGGNYSIDPIAQKATYMFNEPRYVECQRLGEMHDVTDGIGKSMATAYGCDYEASEFYITSSQETADWLENNGFVP